MIAGWRAESPIDLTSSPVAKKKLKIEASKSKTNGVARRRYAYALWSLTTPNLLPLRRRPHRIPHHPLLARPRNHQNLPPRPLPDATRQLCYIPEEDPATVKLWRLYRYTGKIFGDDDATDQDKPDDCDEESHADGEWTKLTHCYFFSQKVQDEAFANACVSALNEKVKETERSPTRIVSEVHGCTQPGDKLRRLIVDLHVWIGQGTCYEAPHEDVDGPENFQDEFRRENAWAQSVDHEGEWAWEIRPCRAYHEHVLTERC